MKVKLLTPISNLLGDGNTIAKDAVLDIDDDLAKKQIGRGLMVRVKEVMKLVHEEVPLDAPAKVSFEDLKNNAPAEDANPENVQPKSEAPKPKKKSRSRRKGK